MSKISSGKLKRFCATLVENNMGSGGSTKRLSVKRSEEDESAGIIRVGSTKESYGFTLSPKQYLRFLDLEGEMISNYVE